MDLVSGCPFSQVKNGLPAVYPTLREDVECEVVVVGGGISGALIAYHLAEAGVAAVVIDRREIGTGSTAASTSLIQYEPDESLTQLSRKLGETDAVRAYRLCRGAVRKLRTLAKKEGGARAFVGRESLYFASEARQVAGLERECALRAKHGFDVEWWTLRRIEAESTLPYRGAILSKDSGYVDAYLLTHCLMGAAQRRGLRVYDRVRMTSHRRRGGRLEVRTDRGASVFARKIVFATGYEAQELLSQKVSQNHSTYALVTEPLDDRAGWPGDRLLWETARPYLYLRPTGDGRAIIGGYDEDFRDPRARDALLPAKTAALARRFRQLLPKIDMDVAYAWTGTFAETKDSLPYIGASPEHPDALFALGYGGNGVVFSLIAAEIIRDLVLDGKAADAELFRFGR